MLCHFVAFWAVFLNIHALRMFFLVPGTDIVFIATFRTFKSDTVSHGLASSLFTCTIIAYPNNAIQREIDPKRIARPLNCSNSARFPTLKELFA